MRSRKVIVQESSSARLIEQSRVRLMAVAFFFLLCFGSIAVRMVDVAVFSAHRSVTITVTNPDDDAVEQVEVTPDAASKRSDVVDRNGKLLATSLKTASMFANPKEIREPQVAAKQLEKVLGIDDAQLLKHLTSNKSFVWIKRNLTPREQAAANSLGIPGLYFLPEERRVYPYGNLLSHVVGYVGVDNKGLAGIEKYFDAQLRSGAQDDKPLALSLDVSLQAILREEMHASVEHFRAIGATGLIMDVSTGELLAMSSLPDFDPNKPSRATDAQKFNRATLGTYEMGSTFKTFTMAMGLDYGVVKMKGGYDATNPFKIATFTISDTHPKKRWLSVPEIFAYSSNIGTAKMALDVGGKRQREFLDKLGMMKQVEIELPEKAQPQVPSERRDISIVTISYGHGISVTPLHLARGIAAMVSGGTLPKLTLLHDRKHDASRQERVIREETSQHMRRLMRLVVGHGTGSKANVPGYRVGGKTGTAEKINAGGVYNEDAKIASFVAVFPSDAPKYLVLVMVDEPKGDQSTYGYATGGWIAAPVVGNVISRMGMLYGIKPRFDVPEDDAEKYWTERDEKPKPAVKALIHAATY
ncbi:MAG: penicillin-binding protein 2 [Rickettsiales bacterium]|nr:penicillin-binding protein 2 [Rickettsiales bacterium]